MTQSNIPEGGICGQRIGLNSKLNTVLFVRFRRLQAHKGYGTKKFNKSIHRSHHTSLRTLSFPA